MANPFMAMRRAMKSRADVYSLEEKQKLFNEYRDSIGLKVGTALTSDAFEQLVKDRIVDYHGFKDTQAPGNLKFHEVLASDRSDIAGVLAARQAVRLAIADALTPPEFDPQQMDKDGVTPLNKITKAKKDYEDSIDTFKELVKGIPEKYKVEDLIGVMRGIHDDASTAIKEQQAHEIQALETKFQNDAFKLSFKNAMGYSDDDSTTIQKNMIGDLKAAHEKQLTAFNESAATSLNTLHQASAKQNTEFLFLANLNKNNEQMRETMRLIAAKKVKAAETTGNKQNLQAEIGIDEKRMTISGLSINDITIIENTTGKNITRNAQGGYELEFGRYILNPLYYSSPKNNVEMDIRTLVEATKASGAKGIVMNVNFSNPELAITRAKQCYKACIESGYDPKDIKMNVNGKLMKPEEIYSTEGHRLQALHGKSAKIIKQLEELASSPSNAPAKNVAAAKAEMVQLKEKARENDAKPKAPANVQPPSAAAP